MCSLSSFSECCGEMYIAAMSRFFGLHSRIPAYSNSKGPDLGIICRAGSLKVYSNSNWLHVINSQSTLLKTISPLSCTSTLVLAYYHEGVVLVIRLGALAAVARQGATTYSHLLTDHTRGAGMSVL